MGIGAIIGAFTGLFQVGMDMWGKVKLENLKLENKKLDHAHDIALIEAETKATIAEAQAHIQVTESATRGKIKVKQIETDGVVSAKAQDRLGTKLVDYKYALGQLYAYEGYLRFITVPVALVITTLFSWIDAVKAAMQPFLTVFMCGITSVILIQAYEVLAAHGLNMTVASAAAMWSMAVEAILYITVHVILSHFGIRANQSSLKKRK